MSILQITLSALELGTLYFFQRVAIWKESGHVTGEDVWGVGLLDRTGRDHNMRYEDEGVHESWVNGNLVHLLLEREFGSNPECKCCLSETVFATLTNKVV